MCCRLILWGIVVWASSRCLAADSLPGTFAYVLQAEKLARTKSEAVKRLAQCRRDWLVLDAGWDTDPASRWTKDELTQIRRAHPGRKILAYLSIGEAERYRSYWQASWDKERPPFLLSENPDWPGNYRVRYWMEEWQSLVLRQVDRLMSQGFDGLYLDKVDSYEDFEFDAKSGDWIDHRKNRATGRTFRSDMIAWVQRVADRARRVNSRALIVPQNGAPLVDADDYRRTISGIALEDLWTNGRRRQPPKMVRRRMGHVRPLLAMGKSVLCIEYAVAPQLREEAAQSASEAGYCLLITDRNLTSLGKSLEEFGYLGPGYGNATKRFTDPRDMTERDWSDPQEIRRTWEAALVRIPGEAKSDVMRATMRVLPAEATHFKRRWPTVIYLHGCSGVWAGTYRRIDFLAAQGYAVIAPASFARRKYPRSCDPVHHRGGLYRPTLRMRQEDAGYAVVQAKKLAWVDPNNVFLVGFSQGAITAATFRSDDPDARVNARILEGWTCHAGWEEYRGVRAPRSEPVLALVAKNDPWFQHSWNRGDCGRFLDPTNGSRSVVFDRGKLANQHALLEDRHVQQLVLDFLRQHRRPKN